MAVFSYLTAALALASTAIASPISRCGTVVYPDKIYLLSEGDAKKVTEVGNNFNVTQYHGQNGVVMRDYLYVKFKPTPAGSWGCSLDWKLDAGLHIDKSTGPFTQLQVKLSDGTVANPSWDSIVTPGAKVFSEFGIANAVVPTDAVVNSQTCSNEGSGAGLSYVVKLPDQVEQSNVDAWLAFQMSRDKNDAFSGFYLTYGC